MKGMQKTISIWLTLCLMLSMLPVQVFAAEETETLPEPEPVLEFVTDTYAADDGISSDEAYEAYIGSVFFGDVALFARAAGDTLTGDEKLLYDGLAPYIKKIANGERTSASITVGQRVTDGGTVYPVDAEAVFTGAEFTSEMLGHVVDALLADLPYECYWFDKTSGCAMSGILGSSMLQITVQFRVAKNYRGADEYTADTAKTGAAKAAAAKAQSIVNSCSSAADYGKLVAYRNEICALVSYDDAAAAGNYFSTDIDPWQLISVFDGDSSTNVVCEGYAKAFMYLCDLTVFSGDVACYTVTGTMDGGNHMWNVVDFNGRHYLADVTNSDAGTIGEDGSLFMAGGTGSVAGGYSVAGEAYAYDSETISLWGSGSDSILALAATDYTPEGEGGGTITGTCGENVYWEFDGNTGTMKITGSGAMHDFLEGELVKTPWGLLMDDIRAVEIAEGVTSIGSGAFYDTDNLTKLTIPGSMRTIGEAAFWGAGLTKATIPEGVTKIDAYAFTQCAALTDIAIPKSVTSIGSSAFSSCASLKSVTIPGNVTRIEDHTFTFCESLTSVKLPSTVTYIGEGAFNACSGLKTMTIPANVTVIGPYAFDSCTGLTSLGMSEGVKEIGWNAFYQCSSLTSLKLPQSVTNIGDYAFSGCDNLETIILPDKITDCGEHAFSFMNNTKLTAIRIPEGVTAIAQNSFYGCTSLATVTFPESLKSIGERAFYDCQSLTGIVIPNGVTSIEKSAFSGCSGLTDVTLGEGVTSIGPFAFIGCNSLTNITIPASVKTIGDVAFSNCYALTSVTFRGDAPAIQGDAFEQAEATVYYPVGNATWTADVMQNYGGKLTWKACCMDGHSYSSGVDGTCNTCKLDRAEIEYRISVHMFRMYNPNTGEHFYTGSEVEKNNLIKAGWNYEGIGFTFPANTGLPVHRLFQPSTGEHLYTMNEAEKARLMKQGWNYEGIAFNSAYDTEAVQHRLHNPNAKVGAYHFTFSEEEKQNLINAGWEYQGIGWYSCWK